jgi:hypothetical protein
MNLFACLMPIFLVIKPVFGFILTAKDCCCPGRFLERTIVLPETISLGRYYPRRPGSKVAIGGKSISKMTQTQMAIR